MALPAAVTHAAHTACARTPAPPAGASLPPADGDGPPQPTVAELASSHPAGRAGLAAALAAALPRDNALDGVAAASLAARARADFVARETAARAVVAAEARSRAARAAAGLTAAKRVAVGWLRRTPAAATVARARVPRPPNSPLPWTRWTPCRLAPPPTGPPPPLIAAHDALRDVAGVAVGPKLAAGVPDIVATTTRASACRDATVAAAADRVLASWRAAAGARLAALTRRAALADPEEEVEAVLAEGAATIDAAARGRVAAGVAAGGGPTPLEVKEEAMQVG